MKLFEMARTAFKRNFVYRLQFLSSIIISPVVLIMIYFVWDSIYKNNPGEIKGYTFEGMITYYVLVMVIGHFIYNTVGNKLQNKVVYGDLNQDLLKPMSIFAQFFSSEIADRGFAFFMEVLPVFIISYLLFGIKIASPYHGLLFFLGLILAFVINYLLGYIAGIFSFWIKDIGSIQWLLFFFIRFFSGEFIPLDFLGEGFLELSRFMPFYYIRYGLVNVALGKQGLMILVFQVGWILLLLLIVHVLWKKAIRQYGGVGG